MLPAGHASTAGSPIPRHTAALHGYLQHTTIITSSNNGALTPQWPREISDIKPMNSKIEKPQNELKKKWKMPFTIKMKHWASEICSQVIYLLNRKSQTKNINNKTIDIQKSTLWKGTVFSTRIHNLNQWTLQESRQFFFFFFRHWTSFDGWKLWPSQRHLSISLDPGRRLSKF